MAQDPKSSNFTCILITTSSLIVCQSNKGNVLKISVKLKATTLLVGDPSNWVIMLFILGHDKRNWTNQTGEGEQNQTPPVRVRTLQVEDIPAQKGPEARTLRLIAYQKAPLSDQEGWALIEI